MKRLFFVIAVCFISPIIQANENYQHNMIRAMSVRDFPLLRFKHFEPEKLQSDMISLNKYDRSGSFLFPTNVSYTDPETMKRFHDSMEKTENLLKKLTSPNQIWQSPRHLATDSIKKAHTKDRSDTEFDLLVSQSIYQNRDKYPELARMWIHESLLPYFMYVELLSYISFVIENHMVRLLKPYDGKTIIDWAFFLGRENVLSGMVQEYPQLLEQEQEKLKLFLKKILKKDSPQILKWLLQNNVNITAQEFQQALYQAILENRLKTAEVLLKEKLELLSLIDTPKLMDQLLQQNRLKTAIWLDKMEQNNKSDLSNRYRQNIANSIAKWLKSPPAIQQIAVTELIIRALERNDLETAQWLYQKQPTALQKIDTEKLMLQTLQNNNLEIAQWLDQKVPEVISQLDSKELMLQALNNNNLKTAQWLDKKVPKNLQNKDRIHNNELIDIMNQALLSNHLETAEWLYQRLPEIISQLDNKELMLQALKTKSFETAQWLWIRGISTNGLETMGLETNGFGTLRLSTSRLGASGLGTRTNILFNQSELADIVKQLLRQTNLESLDWLEQNIKQTIPLFSWEKILHPSHSNRTDKIEFIHELLQANNFPSVIWLANNTTAKVLREHLDRALKQENLVAGEWILEQSSGWLQQLDLKALGQSALDQQNFLLTSWLVSKGMELQKEHLDKAINESQLKTADWLVEKKQKLLELIDRQAHFDNSVVRGDIAIAEWLWNKGAVKVSEGHFDRAEGHPEMEAWILDKIGVKAPTPEQPLAQQMLSAITTQKDLNKIIALEQKGADINEAYRDHTPLTQAIETRNHQLISYFMKHEKILIDTQIPETGMTALLWAVQRGDLGTSNHLLKKGANPSIQNNKGQDALDLAERIIDPNIKQKMSLLINKALCKREFSPP